MKIKLFHIGKLPKDFGEPDFHVRVRGTPESIGSTSEEPAVNHAPVYNMYHKLDPRYLKYAFEHAKLSGKLKPHASGTTRLQGIKHRDMHSVITSILARKNEAVDPEERKLRLRKIQDKSAKLRVASGLAAKAGASKKSKVLWLKHQQAKYLVKSKLATFAPEKFHAKNYSHVFRSQRKRMKEAVDPAQRKNRVAKVWKRAEILAGARTLAMNARASGWMEYGNKANKAARIATAYDSKPYEGSRRQRLAKILSKARSGFAAARDGSRSAYQPAAKAFNVYKKFRYDHKMNASRPLTPGGMVFHPGSSFHVTHDDFILPVSRYAPPLVVKKAGTKPVRFPEVPRDSNPLIAGVRHGTKRIARKFTNQADREYFTKQLLRSRGLSKAPDPLPKDRSKTLPAHATMNPEEKRISKPKIHRPQPANNTNFDLSRRGEHPMSYMIKKNIGHKERKSWSRWAKPREQDL